MPWCARDTSPGTWPPTDQANVAERLMRDAKWTGRDPRRAAAGAAGNAVEARGVERFRQGHRRQDGGEAAGLDNSCLKHPFPFVRAWQACTRENASHASRR
jgi:hypothetical protein